MSPHSANVDRIKVEQYCGGILTRLWCSRVSRQIVVLADKPQASMIVEGMVANVPAFDALRAERPGVARPD